MLRFEVLPLNKSGDRYEMPFRLSLHAVPRADEIIRTSGEEGGHTLFKVIAVAHHAQVGGKAELAGTLIVTRSDTNTFAYSADLHD